ncbi:DUF92 domain-containing protein [Neobacillus piezotolerans]|uniref:DUF92 domain-containing protein n=1 Tax=Neobacillus piezotolerans TaxID=2259171 RepID=A0A3D8GM14_9BACI|nr:DUF92 domain-containing protein [Neobacillus piezotolerans]
MLGSILIIVAAWMGWKLKALTVTGALSAVVIGFMSLAGTGARGLILLGAFFVSSSLWSKYKAKNKAAMDEKLAKGATRDWKQVAANGGPASICSMLFLTSGNPVWLICFAAAISSANSDTWASEIGPISKRDPISIKGFKRAERGTSGAVSLLGTGASLAGAGFIAILAIPLFGLPPWTGFIIFISGFLGSVIDTILGAYFQVSYKCAVCGLETEKERHCGQAAMKVKGNSLLDNDLVNFLSGAAAVLGAYIAIL